MIKKIKAYYLKDSNGNELTLCYGREVNENTGEVFTAANAQRWVMYGKRIPMPVRSGTWFQGLGDCEMVAWLNDAGYTLDAYVNLSTGIMHKCAENKISIFDVEHHIRCAYRGDNKTALVALYKDITGMSIHDSRVAVEAIIDSIQY